MGEEELERVMVDFVAHKYDVLLATTIIENGLDIPNANTMIVNRADRYGLAQLYQLRGRVGRSDRRAYAYLMIPPEETLSQIAKKRLAAIREFSDLGSGFRVAALDLEIRGAGNLLGGEQSGHIEAVGFDMYMKLLEQTIKELKGEEIESDVKANVNLRVDLRIDETYIPDMNQRLTVYRRMAAVRTDEELRRIIDEVRDRYGSPPESVLNLAEYASIRLLADRLGLESVDREGAGRRLKVQAGDEAGSGPCVQPGATARRSDAGAPRNVEAQPRGSPANGGCDSGQPVVTPGRPDNPQFPVEARKGPGCRRLVVGGPRKGRRGYRRVHEGRNHAAGDERGSPVRNRRLHSGVRPAEGLGGRLTVESCKILCSNRLENQMRTSVPTAA